MLLSTYLVTNTNDSGPGSLRQAILDADADRSASAIQFSLGTGLQTIRPTSPLPVVTRGTQIGAGPIDLQVPPPPTVELDGSQAGPLASGLVLGPAAQGARVLGLIINRFAGDGIDLQGIQQGVFNSYIGVDATGTTAAGNRQVGINVTGAGQIQSDVVSGNYGSGILISGPNASATITRSYIGTDWSGTAAVGNGVNPNAPHRDGITALNNATIGGNVTLGPNGLLNNVISGNRGNGIYVGGPFIQIIQSAIGTDVTGSLPLGNMENGVVFANPGKANRLGASGTMSSGQPFPTSYGGNVIAANGGDGVLVLSDGNSILGNYIGANIVGAPLGNGGDGVEIRGGSDNTLSGDTIAANGGAGVSIGADSSLGRSEGGFSNVVQGCNIGITPRLTARTGNAGNGVEVFASDNVIGTSAATGNVIARNGGSGVFLRSADRNKVMGNFIGTARLHSGVQPALGNADDGVTVDGSSNNSITQNAIFGNGHNGVTVTESALGPGATGNLIQNPIDYNNAGLGIDLGDDGVTPNHPGGIALGPNNFQNYPVLTSLKILGNAQVMIGYTLDAPPGSYTVDFYSVAVPDPSGHGQSQSGPLQQTISVASGPAKTYFATLTLPTASANLTATATDSSGNTSEFARDLFVFLTPPQVVGRPVFDEAAGTVTAQFTQDVSASLTPGSLSIVNTKTGHALNPTGVTYNAATNTAIFTVPHPLPQGTYQATLLSSAISNVYGNPLLNPQGTHDFTFTFAVASADLDHDGVVDFYDLVILAGHYGHSGTIADGDLNGDGKIDFRDLAILAQAYGHSA